MKKLALPWFALLCLFCGCASQKAELQTDGDQALLVAATYLLPDMDSYLFQRADAWPELDGAARAQCLRENGDATEALTVWVVPAQETGLELPGSTWPEVETVGGRIFRRSTTGGREWSTTVDSVVVLIATSKQMLLQSLAARASNREAGHRETYSLFGFRGELDAHAMTVVRRSTAPVASLRATWDREAEAVAVVVEGPDRAALVSELIDGVGARLAASNACSESLAIPAGFGEGKLHVLVLMSGLFGQWPTR